MISTKSRMIDFMLTILNQHCYYYWLPHVYYLSILVTKSFYSIRFITVYHPFITNQHDAINMLCTKIHQNFINNPLKSINTH